MVEKKKEEEKLYLFFLYVKVLFVFAHIEVKVIGKKLMLFGGVH